jgi:hypothetical protein
MTDHLIIDDVPGYFSDVDVVFIVKQFHPIVIPRRQGSAKHFYNDMTRTNVYLGVTATRFVCATRIALVIWCLNNIGALFLSEEAVSSGDTGGDDELSAHRSNEKEISHGRVSWQTR